MTKKVENNEQIPTVQQGDPTYIVTPEEYQILKNIEQIKLEQEQKETEINKRLKEISDRELKQDSKKTGNRLRKEPMVLVTIPKSELNPNELSVPVTINGYTYNILRGKEVEVPKTVKDILKEAKYI